MSSDSSKSSPKRLAPKRRASSTSDTNSHPHNTRKSSGSSGSAAANGPRPTDQPSVSVSTNGSSGPKTSDGSQGRNKAYAGRHWGIGGTCNLFGGIITLAKKKHVYIWKCCQCNQAGIPIMNKNCTNCSQQRCAYCTTTRVQVREQLKAQLTRQQRP